MLAKKLDDFIVIASGVCLVTSSSSVVLALLLLSLLALLLSLLALLLTLLTLLGLSLLALLLSLLTLTLLATSLSGTSSEVDTVIQRAVLGHSNNDRLMVGRGIDRAESVRASGETWVNLDRNKSVSISLGVHTLEEDERLRVGRSGLVQAGQLVDGDVSVTDDGSGTVELLRSSEVVLVGIDEVSCRQVLHGHADRESLVGGDGSTVLGVRKLGRGHPVGAGNQTDGCGIT